MKLLLQPDDGAGPLVRAIRQARKCVQIVIFRFDLAPLEQALGQAVGRGVSVRALIAHTNRGGEKRLRKLEQRLLSAGVTVARRTVTKYRKAMNIPSSAFASMPSSFTVGSVFAITLR